MLNSSVATSPAFQHVGFEDDVLDNELASFAYRGPASTSELVVHEADAWPIDATAAVERRRPGRAEYDSEMLIQILRQQIAEAELSVTCAKPDASDRSDLRPAIGLIVSVGLSALFWISSLSMLNILT
jgi:ribosomal protein S18 acetylase RimI-like enzyme